jgi:hypothetical protein
MVQGGIGQGPIEKPEGNEGSLDPGLPQKPEPRWPALLALVALGCLYAALPLLS